MFRFLLEDKYLMAVVACAALGNFNYADFYNTEFEIGFSAKIYYPVLSVAQIYFHFRFWHMWLPLHQALQESRKNKSWRALSDDIQEEISEGRQLAKRTVHLHAALMLIITTTSAYAFYHPVRTFGQQICFILASLFPAKMMRHAQEDLRPSGKTFKEYTEVWSIYGKQGATWLDLMWWLNNAKEKSPNVLSALWAFLVLFHVLVLVEGLAEEYGGGF
ncbi:hypothetical protein QBC43DRAFT_292703 [Cladorrhinum sp. PSN259]|nr:hypothetical protein QBC43DRAFT_292703 [Cladorrhinum sp. PSN259]